MLIREAHSDDAAGAISLLQRLYAETRFLLYEPGESVPTQAGFARRIAGNAELGAGTMFLSEGNGALNGILVGNRGTAGKTRHTLSLVLGVVQAAWRQGVGSALLTAAEGWATGRGVHRLELMVRTDNLPAITLYEKCGFQREGLKRHTLYIEGAYYDEYLMAKLLPHGEA